MLKRCGRVVAPASMNWRSLNNCAARSNEPVKTLALWQLPDRSGAIAATTDRRNRGEMLSYQIQIN
jgi:hypothetical protein